MAAALRCVSKFNSSREIVEFKCDYSNYVPRVKAVIGAGYSEISMAVSRTLSLQLMPQVVLFYYHWVGVIIFFILNGSG